MIIYRKVSRKIFTLLYLTLVLIIDLRIVATQQNCDMCFVKVYILVQVDHYVNYSTCLDKIKWSDFYQIIRTTRHVPKNPTIADHARLVAKSYTTFMAWHPRPVSKFCVWGDLNSKTTTLPWHHHLLRTCVILNNSAALTCGMNLGIISSLDTSI